MQAFGFGSGSVSLHLGAKNTHHRVRVVTRQPNTRRELGLNRGFAPQKLAKHPSPLLPSCHIDGQGQRDLETSTVKLRFTS